MDERTQKFIRALEWVRCIDPKNLGVLLLAPPNYANHDMQSALDCINDVVIEILSGRVVIRLEEVKKC